MKSTKTNRIVSRRRDSENDLFKFVSLHGRVLTISFFSFVLAMLIMISGFYVWTWMQKPSSFPIKQIHIQGQLTHVTPAQVQKIIQAQLTGGFFSLNMASIKQQISALPWIADVSFRRVWPNTLNVRLTEQQPVARFGKKGLLSLKGDFFYPDEKTIPLNLPELDGPKNQSQALLSFYQSTNLLAKLLGLSVFSVRLDAEQNWSLQLSNQIQVTIGHHDAWTRFKRFVAIYPKLQALSTQQIVAVDLRYPNGVAVKYK